MPQARFWIAMAKPKVATVTPAPRAIGSTFRPRLCLSPMERDRIVPAATSDRISAGGQKPALAFRKGFLLVVRDTLTIGMSPGQKTH